MQKVEGIILKTSSFEESAHILHILSKEFGLVSIVAKLYATKIQRSYSPLLKVEARIIPSEKELWRCKELEITQSYPSLRLSLNKLTLASYLVQQVYQIVPRRCVVEHIYTLLDEHLSAFSDARCPYLVASSFLMKFLYLEGMLPKIPMQSQAENSFFQKVFELPATALFGLEWSEKEPERMFRKIVKSCERGDLNPYEENLTTTSK